MLSIRELQCEGQTVFLRVDFNVPLDTNRSIRNDIRIQAALPTIRFLLERKARLIVASHLGRPKGKVVPELSMEPVARRLRELIGTEVFLAPSVLGEDVEGLKASLNDGQVLLLENLRFEPGEKANDPAFARELARNVDIYVNDAFGACHRAHASVVGLPALVGRKAAGFLLDKEVKFLNRVIHSPESPFIAILGGAKVSDKIPVIRNLLQKADTLLIGGAMAYTFAAAEGEDVGRSLVEKDMLETARELLERSKKHGAAMLFPRDHVTALAMDEPDGAEIVRGFPLPPDRMGLDIGPETIADFTAVISGARTIFWNGPMGVFEQRAFAQGTLQIAQAVAGSSALSIIGGGDSVAAVAQSGLSEKISHISTGGGASLEYIANETLPGLEALK
ncbi:MAG: phosphoglycerate kinase [Candidatus Aminicenantes bacterium]|nr:phosphoglycerate kinase [Candidatus Aminicenantes bacterium]